MRHGIGVPNGRKSLAISTRTEAFACTPTIGTMKNGSGAMSAKDEAMARVDAAASDTWKVYMREAVRQTCLRMNRFTSDDVFDRVDADPNALVTHELRAFGPVII